MGILMPGPAGVPLPLPPPPPAPGWLAAITVGFILAALSESCHFLFPLLDASRSAATNFEINCFALSCAATAAAAGAVVAAMFGRQVHLESDNVFVR